MLSQLQWLHNNYFMLYSIVPIKPVSQNIMDHTMDTKVIPTNVTFNFEPLAPTRTFPSVFFITNSQNNEVLLLEPVYRSFTMVLAPGTITFNITTLYPCPFKGDPLQYIVAVPDPNPEPRKDDLA